MGFHKRYIHKDNILNILNSDDDVASITRDITIDRLFNADALIMDKWVNSFYEGLNPEERKIREYFYEKYLFYSLHEFLKDEEYPKLKSLSEALISLHRNPSWVDIIFTVEKLKLTIKLDESGRFDSLIKKCINAIIDHFEN